MYTRCPGLCGHLKRCTGPSSKAKSATPLGTLQTRICSNPFATWENRLPSPTCSGKGVRYRETVWFMLRCVTQGPNVLFKLGRDARFRRPLQHRVHIFSLGADAMWSVVWFEAAWGRYVSANTSSAFLSQPCPVSVEVISRTFLITSPGGTKGDGRVPATIASRYRLASPSATGSLAYVQCKLCCPSYSGRNRLRLFACGLPR